MKTTNGHSVARLLASDAGLPLLDRYGYDASDDDVQYVIDAIAAHADDAAAAEVIGVANAVGDIQLCRGYDTPIDETDEVLLVRTLRPLVPGGP